MVLVEISTTGLFTSRTCIITWQGGGAVEMRGAGGGGALKRLRVGLHAVLGWKICFLPLLINKPYEAQSGEAMQLRQQTHVALLPITL